MTDPRLELLVVDREPAARMMLSRYLQRIGHRVTEAGSGDEAIRWFKTTRFDVVIIAAILPDIDGYETTRRLKALTPTRWTPVMLMGDAIRPEDQIDGLKAGADDYLTTPINLTIMAYKLKAMQRIASMQATLSSALTELREYQTRTEEELMLARHMMRRLCHHDDIDMSAVRYLNKPAGGLSGDVIASETLRDGVRYLLLADITGHGLSSALNAIPLVQDFFVLARQGMPLPSLCRHINQRLHHVLPLGYFVAALLVRIDQAGKRCQIWNGGLPTAWFLSPTGGLERQFPSRHPAMGILDDDEFEAECEDFAWSMPGQLAMFTDGVIEAASATGGSFGEERLLQSIKRSLDAADLSDVECDLNHFMAGQPAHDDWSLLVVRCGY